MYTKVSIAQPLNAKPYRRSKPFPKIILLFPRCCILQSIHSFSVHFINLYHVNFTSVFNLSIISQQIQKCFSFFSKTYILMRSIPISPMLVLCKVTNVAGTDPGEVDGVASHTLWVLQLHNFQSKLLSDSNFKIFLRPSPQTP